MGLAIGAASCALFMGPGSAAAEVLSIGDDGAVTTYAGPQLFTSEGARPIEPVAEALSRATPAEVAAAIRESSARHAVPAPLVEAVAWQESRYNQAAVSPKGARGVMQLMPATAVTLGVDAGDLKSNIDGGVAYLAQQMRRYGDLRLALAAYNAGPRAVDRYGGVPPYAETQTYVRAILARLASAPVVSE
ncbi:lytic transglycosylase domain-containing protein [uncultured Phenylobacterium sp.]|uniref:lytic transglycosylase domain-containing protein n=1 Tax=uncultured Phenylobacterium sp. TaxID=349273 RepID=UPI0025D7DCEF|nr:lytic transglycosylase domain-containing protein [uncultured Phenylobacterium sp.]